MLADVSLSALIAAPIESASTSVDTSKPIPAKAFVCTDLLFRKMLKLLISFVAAA